MVGGHVEEEDDGGRFGGGRGGDRGEGGGGVGVVSEVEGSCEFLQGEEGADVVRETWIVATCNPHQ